LLLKKSALAGHPKAQLTYAQELNARSPTNENRKEIAFWLNLSAHQDEPVAQYNLAIIYFNGLGLKKNNFEAMRWLEISTSNGYVKAAYTLGALLLSNKINEEKAIKWLEIASEGGQKQATLHLLNHQRSKTISPETLARTILLLKRSYFQEDITSISKAIQTISSLDPTMLDDYLPHLWAWTQLHKNNEGFGLNASIAARFIQNAHSSLLK